MTFSQTLQKQLDKQKKRQEANKKAMEKYQQPNLEVRANWQTRGRGTNEDEYNIYLACTHENPPKTFEQWMGR